ncbi:MAG: hypothetical protein K8T91_03350 [Planctomycetes bacterium]|nr:hypothetical protein [Planctomycetota bacterium]
MATSPADIAAPPSRPTQYSLRGVLLLTAAVAGACALGSWLGAGWLPLLLGMTLYLANYLGMLGFVQGRRVAQTALYLAALAWVVSLFLPLVDGNSGWVVALCCNMDWEGAFPELRTHGIAWNLAGQLLLRVAGLTLVGASDLANVGMTLCPLLAHRLVVGKARWLHTILVVSTPGVWTWYFTFAPRYPYSPGTDELAPAYVAWCGALTITAIVLRISRWQLIAATAMSMWLSVGAWVWIDWIAGIP